MQFSQVLLEHNDFQEHIPFGKHRHKSWFDVWKHDFSYVEWVFENAADRMPVKVYEAAKLILQTEEKKTMEDVSINQMKNRVAFLDASITTVAVVYGVSDYDLKNVDRHSDAAYTYKVTKAFAQTLSIGDVVVVPAKGEFKLAQIVEIHEENEINPDSNIDYKWVVSKCDFVDYERNVELEAENVKTIKASIRAQAREKYRQACEFGNVQLKQIGHVESVQEGDSEAFREEIKYKMPEGENEPKTVVEV